MKNLDKIALIENGKIVESGTHKELIAKRDKYFILIKSCNLNDFMEKF